MSGIKIYRDKYVDPSKSLCRFKGRTNSAPGVIICMKDHSSEPPLTIIDRVNSVFGARGARPL